MVNVVMPNGTIAEIQINTPDMLAAKGAQGKKMTLKYQAVYETGAPKGWPGPGIVNEGFTKDDTQWHWWLYWRQLMGDAV